MLWANIRPARVSNISFHLPGSDFCINLQITRDLGRPLSEFLWRVCAEVVWFIWRVECFVACDGRRNERPSSSFNFQIVLSRKIIFTSTGAVTPQWTQFDLASFFDRPLSTTASKALRPRDPLVQGVERNAGRQAGGQTVRIACLPGRYAVNRANENTRVYV